MSMLILYFCVTSIEKLSEKFRYLTYIIEHILFTQFLYLHVVSVVDEKLEQITIYPLNACRTKIDYAKIDCSYILIRQNQFTKSLL